jgi:hypothetical protein
VRMSRQFTTLKQSKVHFITSMVDLLGVVSYVDILSVVLGVISKEED